MNKCYKAYPNQENRGFSCKGSIRLQMTCELFISSFIRDHMWIWIALSLDLPDTWVNSTIIHTPSSLNVIKLYTCLEPSLLLPISLKQEVKTWLNLRSSIVLYHYKLSTSSVLIDAEDIPWSCGCFILSLTMPEYMIPLLCRWRISLHLVLKYLVTAAIKKRRRQENRLRRG